MVSSLQIFSHRWGILVLASVAYVSSHSYLFATLCISAFDILVECFCLFLLSHKKENPIELLVDGVVRILTIFLIVTILAFVWYAYDLSFLYGLQWLYFSVVAYLYFLCRFIDVATRGIVHANLVFVVVSLGMLVFFMNFVAYGEPYTFMTEMLYILSVFFLIIVSWYYGWWAFLAFIIFWIFVLCIGLIVNAALDHNYRYPVSHYFTQTPWLK